MAVTLKYSNGGGWVDIPFGTSVVDTVNGVGVTSGTKNIVLSATHVGALPITGGTLTGGTTAVDAIDAMLTQGTLKVNGGISCNMSIWGATVHGAVWNDYAEYRHCNEIVEPGTVLMEMGNGDLGVTVGRTAGTCVVSDTFGFSIGQNEQNETPVALAGRVLAKVSSKQKRKKLVPGAAVCSDMLGTVRTMGRIEKILHPDCILGYVSEVPTYEVWHGQNDVVVNGRIWIKLK